MTDEPQLKTELERLRAENERLYQANLELLLRQADMNHENHQLWEFVMTAKRLHSHLTRRGYHDDSKEWMRFIMSFERLRQWMERRERELNQLPSVTEAEQPAV